MVSAPTTRPAGARRRIRVAFFIDNHTIGGTELNAVRTAERLDRERFELSVFCLAADGPLKARYERAGIPVESIPIANLYGPAALGTGTRVTRLLRHREVDIVHCHDRYSNVFGGFWGHLAGRPRMIASRRWWDGEGPAFYRHGNRLAYRCADRVLANSAAVGRLLVDSDGVRPEKLVVIPNFVDGSAFEAIEASERAALRHEFGVPPDALVVGVVANLRPVKDHQTLLRAIALLEPAWRDRTHVVLVGEGSERQPLEQLARELGLGDRVHLPGSRPAVPNLQQLFDVSVLCSLHEGFPNSLVEAMAAARPIVATNVGGNPDAVTHGENGFLVPPQSPDALAAGIATLLADADRRRAMGENGLRRARREFQAETVIPQLERVYEQLAQPRVQSVVQPVVQPHA